MKNNISYVPTPNLGVDDKLNVATPDPGVETTRHENAYKQSVPTPDPGVETTRHENAYKQIVATPDPGVDANHIRNPIQSTPKLGGATICLRQCIIDNIGINT